MASCGDDPVSNPGGGTDTSAHIDTSCKVNCNPDTSCKVNCVLTPGPMGQAPYVALRQSQIDSATDSIPGVHFRMMRIPAKGKSFLSGVPDSSYPLDHYAFPQHRVYFTYDFYMDKSEVEVAEFVRVMNWARGQGLVELVVGSDEVTRSIRISNGGEVICYVQNVGDNSSPENIWYANGEFYSHRNEYTMGMVYLNGAKYYANLRSRLYGLEPVYDSTSWRGDFRRNGFRLPTDAEFEYALRGGVTTKYLWGDRYLGNLASQWGRFDTKNYPACSGKQNAYRLCDMVGGEDEWIEDVRPTEPIRGPQTDPVTLVGVLGSQSFRSGLIDSLRSRSGNKYFQPSNSYAGFRLVLPIR